MVQRSAGDPKLPEELTQHIALLLVAGAIAAGNDTFNCHREGIPRRRRWTSTDNHIETLESKSYVNTGAERIDDISDLYPVFVEFSRISGDVSITPRAFGIWSDRHSITVERRPLGQ